MKYKVQVSVLLRKNHSNNIHTNTIEYLDQNRSFLFLCLQIKQLDYFVEKYRSTQVTEIEFKCRRDRLLERWRFPQL